ncbi:MAG TPA: cytochrome c-type biogenesis protein CcmH [Acidimicrobiales bacterium]|nr:cytochrome c-type biogenesis protein CcmH [Acidimicrobiales bacterium]
MTSRLAWVALALVLLVALFVGARGDGSPPTDAERSARIARSVRCPTCRGLSAGESDAKAAVAVRDEIRRRVARGQSDDAIRAYLVSRYGDDILLAPPSSGVGLAVWALPAVAFVLGALGLAAAFVRWRRLTAVRPTSEDRALVAEARAP